MFATIIYRKGIPLRLLGLRGNHNLSLVAVANESKQSDGLWCFVCIHTMFFQQPSPAHVLPVSSLNMARKEKIHRATTLLSLTLAFLGCIC